MNRPSMPFFLALLLGFTSCNHSLSDKEAIRLIREAKGFPESLTLELSGGPDSGVGREIKRLQDTGYIDSAFSQSCHPTEKGKTLVSNCYWNGVYNYSGIVFHGLTTDVSRIVDRRTEGTNDTIVVLYELTLTPTEELMKFQAADPKAANRATSSYGDITKPRNETARLQKWESGWRVVG